LSIIGSYVTPNNKKESVMIIVSSGQMARQTAQFVYRNSRQLIDAMVQAGKLKPSQAQIEWAKMVSKALLEYGVKVPQTIKQYL